MNERRQIENRLRRKEEELQALEVKVLEARTYIQAYQEVLKILPRNPGAATTPRSLRAGSNMEKVREFVLKKNAPAHVTELLEALGKAATREARASLSGSLAAYVRRGEIFTRPSPNTFGLVELDHEDTSLEEPDEPPADFGRDASSTHPRELFKE